VKKILLVAVALVLGLSGAAMAMQAEIPADSTAAIAKGGTQVTIGGEFRFRGSDYQNISDFNKYAATSTGQSGTSVPGLGTNAPGAAERAVFESRIRLSIEAKTSPNTIGFLQLEMAGNTGATGENQNWGTAGSTVNSYGSLHMGEDKSMAPQVMQAWLQHSGSGLLGIPAYVKVGHQPVTIGAGVFYNHNVYGDDAIIAGITPIKGLDLTAAYVKLYEGLMDSGDDADLYSLIATYAVNKDVVLGLNGTLVDLQNNGALNSLTAGGTNQGKAQLYDLGAYVKANVAGFALKLTGDFQMGTYKPVPTIGITQKTYNGFAITGGAAYTFAPVTIALDLGYGSGDNKTDDKISTFQTLQGHNMGNPGTWVYEYIITNAAGNLGGGLQNTIFGKLSAKADVMKDLNVSGAIAILEAAKKVYGGGSLVMYQGGTPVNNKYIGTEVDFATTYQIDKGLKYFVEAGYLFAGNYWKGVSTAGYTSGTKKVSDPWGIRHGLQLNF
jgi:hypothetical protein